ncbi:hypothetical protein [Halostreptopolyspora alba]
MTRDAGRGDQDTADVAARPPGTERGWLTADEVLNTHPWERLAELPRAP